jgi:hypothetical protein
MSNIPSADSRLRGRVGNSTGDRLLMAENTLVTLLGGFAAELTSLIRSDHNSKGSHRLWCGGSCRYSLQTVYPFRTLGSHCVDSLISTSLG